MRSRGGARARNEPRVRNAINRTDGSDDVLASGMSAVARGKIKSGSMFEVPGPLDGYRIFKRICKLASMLVLA